MQIIIHISQDSFFKIKFVHKFFFKSDQNLFAFEYTPMVLHDVYARIKIS